MTCTKTAEPIEILFGMLTWLGSSIKGGHIGTTWRIRLNRPCPASMRPCCQISLTSCRLTSLHFYCLSMLGCVPVYPTDWMPFLSPNQQCQSTERNCKNHPLNLSSFDPPTELQGNRQCTLNAMPNITLHNVKTMQTHDSLIVNTGKN